MQFLTKDLWIQVLPNAEELEKLQSASQLQFTLHTIHSFTTPFCCPYGTHLPPHCHTYITPRPPQSMFCCQFITNPGCTITDYMQLTTPYGDPQMAVNPQTLVQLKAMIKEQLKNVEQAEAALAEGMKPQTIEEAELLQRKLADAQKEVANRIAELKNKGKG